MSSSITLVKNTKGLLPLTEDKNYLHVAFGENDRGTHLFNKINKYLKGDEIEIFIDIGLGENSWTTLTCDFTKELSKIK